MYIICGLGNPGPLYQNTRHNMGFIAMDLISENLGIPINKLKYKALIGEGSAGTEKVLLVKPQTFMNLSGESLRQIVDFYKPEHSKILLIYDDIDLDPGTVRIRAKGSSGTHNGMRSVIYQLQFDDFPRIRIGIGKNGQIPLDKYVIGKFSEEERPLLAEAVKTAAEAACSFLSEPIDRVMNQYNAKKIENS